MVSVMWCVTFLKRQYISLILVYVCFMNCYSPCDALLNSNLKCKLSGPCKCIFPNGRGVDLSNVSWLSTKTSNQTFYFHPCLYHENNTTPNCSKGVSICVFDNNQKNYTDLGFLNEVVPESKGPTNPIQLIYKHEDIVTKVNLQCTEKETSLSITPPQKNNYEMTLNSPEACVRQLLADTGPSHLSTGSVLVILFIVFSGVYFAGGALALKVLRGAEGKEMIPNYEFWCSLPGLVKEGFLFALNCGKSTQAYDRI